MNVKVRRWFGEWGVTKGKLKADHEVKIDIYRKPKKKRFSDFAEVELINVF